MESGARVYRPRAVLRVALAAAGVFWAVCFAGLFRFRAEVSPWTLWGCLAFVVFFAAMWLYNARLRIDVDDGGVSYRGLRRRLRVSFTDILRVNVIPGVAVRVYFVATRKGFMLFSSHFGGHRELCALLQERAGLVGMPP
jgi:hypothetical protein